MSMRVTESMTSRQVISDLEAGRTQLAQTQREISSGDRINQPSDDPFGTGHTLQLTGELEGLRQYKSNAEDGSGWATASESALSRISEATQRARELVVQGGNDSNGQVAREAIATEIESLIEEVKQEASVTFGGRYIFAGTETDTRPYELGANDAYAGNEGTVVRVIGAGVSLPINVNVKELLGEGQAAGDGKLLDTLRDVAENLRGGTAEDAEALRGTDLTRLDANLDEVSRVRTTVGATEDRLQTAGTRLEELEESTLKQISDVEFTDLPEALVNFATEQAAYETALRAGAKIVQPSLLDFLQ